VAQARSLQVVGNIHVSHRLRSHWRARMPGQGAV